MEDEKIVSKLKWIIKECNEEIEEANKNTLADLTSMLKKVVKNCEVSINLVNDYQTSKDQRAQMI